MQYSAVIVNFFFSTALLKRFPMKVSQLLDFVRVFTGGKL
jgi:hypothetical protein